MSLAESRTARGLPGATVLQIVPALVESGAARAAVDTSIALLRSGARVIVAGDDGPLNSELQGLGGEWVRLVNETTNPISVKRNAGTIAELVAAERVDLVHALGIGASRSATSRASTCLLLAGSAKWSASARSAAIWSDASASLAAASSSNHSDTKPS